MKYLLRFYPNEGLEKLDIESLLKLRTRLNESIADGSLDCAYQHTGGGSFCVVNSSSHEALRRVLRRLKIYNCSVTPVESTIDHISRTLELEGLKTTDSWGEAYCRSK